MSEQEQKEFNEAKIAHIEGAAELLIQTLVYKKLDKTKGQKDKSRLQCEVVENSGLKEKIIRAALKVLKENGIKTYAGKYEEAEEPEINAE